MANSDTLQPVIAQEVHWTYWITSAESGEQNFYIALQNAVAAEIARRVPQGTRVGVGRELQFQLAAYTIRARATNISPVLANTIGTATVFRTEYRERAKDEGQDISQFISEILRYPDPAIGDIFDALAGIDGMKSDMVRQLKHLLHPEYTLGWFKQYHHGEMDPLLRQSLLERYPLVILHGEVGSGKTALARSIGHPVASELNTQIVMYVVSAQIRGGGHVGELTQNIARAFAYAERGQEQENVPVILFIDEADTIARTRGTDQTHHEDDSAVNTLIQRIDRLRGRPIVVILATNLLNALDSAIRRRATNMYKFDRPNSNQRERFFEKMLLPLGFSDRDIANLVKLTEPRPFPKMGERLHRYTYSDLTQRLIPRGVESAMEERSALKYKHLETALEKLWPTPEMPGTGVNLEEADQLVKRAGDQKKTRQWNWDKSR